MRQLRRNKQKMFYALYTEEMPIYATDDEGNILTTEVDGETVQVVDSFDRSSLEILKPCHDPFIDLFQAVFHISHSISPPL